MVPASIPYHVEIRKKHYAICPARSERPPSRAQEWWEFLEFHFVATGDWQRKRLWLSLFAQAV